MKKILVIAVCCAVFPLKGMMAINEYVDNFCGMTWKQAGESYLKFSTDKRRGIDEAFEQKKKDTKLAFCIVKGVTESSVEIKNAIFHGPNGARKGLLFKSDKTIERFIEKNATYTFVGREALQRLDEIDKSDSFFSNCYSQACYRRGYKGLDVVVKHGVRNGFKWLFPLFSLVVASLAIVEHCSEPSHEVQKNIIADYGFQIDMLKAQLKNLIESDDCNAIKNCAKNILRLQNKIKWYTIENPSLSKDIFAVPLFCVFASVFMMMISMITDKDNVTIVAAAFLSFFASKTILIDCDISSWVCDKSSFAFSLSMAMVVACFLGAIVNVYRQFFLHPEGVRRLRILGDDGIQWMLANSELDHDFLEVELLFSATQSTYDVNNDID